MKKTSSPKNKMISATIDLLSQSGLAAVDARDVAAASAASTASVRRLFPGGKLELATVALEEVEQDIGQWFRAVFHQRKSIAEKVKLLFADAAKNVEASGFTKGCPAAAVTLDLDRDSEELRAVCRSVFTSWQDIIATGLDEIPKAKRRETAELILSTLEGALILSRAAATSEPLLRTGKNLGEVLTCTPVARPSRGGRGQRRKKD
jgi:TetR/AcrR family transcriptional repressor of lmrAB and yxaGH operons